MNEIFTHFISREPIDDFRRIGYITWFSTTFPTSEFRGEDLIMKAYCDYSSILGVPYKYKYFATYLSTELKPFLIQTGVRVPGTDSMSFDDPASLEGAYTVTREYMLNQFRHLESYESELPDFPVAAKAFMQGQITNRFVEELQHSYDTLSSKEDAWLATNEALDRLTMLRDVYDMAFLEELENARPREELSKVRKFICDTGMSIIDGGISGGVHTGQLFGIEAQPGAGKTRFALGTWAYRTAVYYKKDVIYYQLEQTEAEARAILVARHVFELYNLIITDELILTDSVPEEHKQKVKAAEIDLFESGKYGKIKIKRTTLYVNNMIQVFKKDDKLFGPFTMVIVDYMGLIEQTEEKYKAAMLDYQVIKYAFRKFKRYVDGTEKCGIAVSQFNDKGIEAAKADKTITTNMAQGGIEVYRNTDQNIAISATKQMEATNKLRLSQPKKRGSRGWDTTVVDTSMGISYIYVNQQAVV